MAHGMSNRCRAVTGPANGPSMGSMSSSTYADHRPSPGQGGSTEHVRIRSSGFPSRCVAEGAPDGRGRGGARAGA